MLILTRKPNESIIINDDTKITVLSNNKKEVRIGISAPKKVAVHREEVYKRIQEEKQNALIKSANEEEVSVA